MDGKKIVTSNLIKTRVTEGDMKSKLRETNVTELNQIKAVIFETTGNISVLHKKDDSPTDLWMMKDVKKNWAISIMAY